MDSNEFPKKGASGSGTETLYSVQARFMFNTPRAFGKLLLDQRWQTVPFERGLIGVPSGPYDLSGQRDRSGLLSYQAAQALRWWFLAQAAAEYHHLCLETRIVKHRLKYEFSEEAIGVQDIVDGDIASGQKAPLS